MPNTKLVIVGRGHLKRRLMRLAKSLGVGEDVTIESSLSFAELAQLYRSSDLVVYPSFYEGQGLIPLEAMASGVPVVTVDHGPLPEMVDESVGALFTMGNIESMVSVMKEVLKVGRKRARRVEPGFFRNSPIQAMLNPLRISILRPLIDRLGEPLMRHDYFGMLIVMANSTSLAKVDSGTLANIAIVLFVSVLAIIHLKAVIQPLVVATLIFF